MSLKLFLLNLFIIAVSLNSSAQMKLTLPQAIEIGIKNNSDVMQSALLSEKYQVAWKQSRLNLLPNLNVSANQGTNFGKSIDPFTNTFIDQKVNYGNYGASSNVVIFNGLALQNEIKANKLGYEASGMELQQAKDNLTINIVLAYLQVLSAKDVLRQAEEQAVVTSKQVDRLSLLNNNGAISPAEYYDLKGQLANDQVTIADSKAALEIAKLSLTQLLNLPYQKDLELAPIQESKISTIEIPSPDSIYQKALHDFAQIKATNLRTQSAESNIKSIKGKLYPTLSFGGNINSNYSSVAAISQYVNSTYQPSSNYVDVNGTQYSVFQKQDHYTSQKLKFGNQLSNNLFYTLNLGLSIPLFNAANIKSQVKMAQIDLKSSKVKEQNSRLLLQQAIESAYINLKTSAEKYELLTGQVKSFEESFRVAEVKFNAGVITSVDYLVAKNNLDRSRSYLIISKYDFLVREKILNYYEGKPVN